jgi:hypothetical protein
LDSRRPGERHILPVDHIIVVGNQLAIQMNWFVDYSRRQRKSRRCWSDFLKNDVGNFESLRSSIVMFHFARNCREWKVAKTINIPWFSICFVSPS